MQTDDRYENLNDGDWEGKGQARSEDEIRYVNHRQFSDNSREVESMTSEFEMLTRQITSMRQRLKSLVEMAGVDSSSGSGGEIDRLTFKIEEVNDQVQLHEGNLLTSAIQ